MEIIITTEVNGNYIDIMDRFDRDLFEALQPNLGKMNILEFTGSKKGDIVSLEFLSPVKAHWSSDITADGSNESEAFFIDEGRILPSPLKYWQHKHIVKKLSDNRSVIIDQINYRAKYGLTLFLYPILYFTFASRKKVYRSYFSSMNS